MKFVPNTFVKASIIILNYYIRGMINIMDLFSKDKILLKL